MVEISESALQELLQAVKDLQQTAKMMRAVGTGGMAGTHPKMLAVNKAMKAVEEELNLTPGPSPLREREESEKEADGGDLQGGNLVVVDRSQFVPYGDTTFPANGETPPASTSKARSKAR